MVCRCSAFKCQCFAVAAGEATSQTRNTANNCVCEPCQKENLPPTGCTRFHMVLDWDGHCFDITWACACPMFLSNRTHIFLRLTSGPLPDILFGAGTITQLDHCDQNGINKCRCVVLRHVSQEPSPPKSSSNVWTRTSRIKAPRVTHQAESRQRRRNCMCRHQ